jgi:hypothetical protein
MIATHKDIKFESPRPGDIGLSRSNTFLGKGIRYFQRMQGEGDAPVNHSNLIASHSGGLIDVLSMVKDGHVTDYLGKEDFYVVRIGGFSCDQCADVVEYADRKWLSGSKIKRVYSWFKILRQVGDSLTGTNFFTRRSLTDNPYCSELVARSWCRVNGHIWRNAVESKAHKRKLYFESPRSITPANIWADAVDRPDVYELYKYELHESVWKLQRKN